MIEPILFLPFISYLRDKIRYLSWISWEWLGFSAQEYWIRWDIDTYIKIGHVSRSQHIYSSQSFSSRPNLNKRSSNKNEDAHWDMVTKHLFIFKYLNVPEWGVIYVYVYHLNLAEFDFFNQMATSSWLRIWYLICSWEIKT